jgi:hypothetical protein
MLLKMAKHEQLPYIEYVTQVAITLMEIDKALDFLTRKPSRSKQIRQGGHSRSIGDYWLPRPKPSFLHLRGASTKGRKGSTNSKTPQMALWRASSNGHIPIITPMSSPPPIQSIGNQEKKILQQPMPRRGIH